MKNINEEHKNKLEVDYINPGTGLQGIHEVDLTSQENKINSASMVKLHANTVIAAPGNPTTYVYNLGGDQMDINGMAKLLSDSVVRDEFTAQMMDPLKIGKMIEIITNAARGQFATNSDNISFEMVKDRLSSVVTVKPNTLYVLANVFTPLRTMTGISAASNQIQYFNPETDIYPSKEKIIAHLEELEIETILGEIKFDFIDGSKKKLGVGDIASKYEAAFFPVHSKLQQLKQIERSYEAVLALVKAHALRDFSAYQPEELGVFSDDRFLALATNYTIIKHALATSTTKPLLGYPFWMQSIERISIGISSSPKYHVTELAAVKEYYKVSIVTEDRGFKKGVIISRNLRENTTLAAFRAKSMVATDAKLSGLTRLFEDKPIEMVLGKIYNALSSITTTTVHDYAERCFQNIVGSDSKHYLYALGIPTEEKEYLAMIFSDQVFLLLDNYEAGRGSVDVAYQINTKDSLIDDNLKTFLSQGLVTNPLVALFYAKELEGKNFISVNGNPIVNTKHTLFKDIGSIFGEPLNKGIKFSMSYKNQALKPEWTLGKLTGLIDLENTYTTQPIVGQIIFSQLMSTHETMINLYKEVFSKDEIKGRVREALESANMHFIRNFKDILANQDVEDMLSSAINYLWTASSSTGGRFGNSIFTEDQLLAELRIRMVFFLANKLGFVTASEYITQVIKAIKESGAFGRLIIIGGK